MTMKQQLLLLKDVDSLGKKVELVTARPGYMRNFLFPQGLAVVATENTLRKQERLRKERAEQAVIDRKESEEMAILVEGAVLEIFVKVIPEGVAQIGVEEVTAPIPSGEAKQKEDA